MGQEFGSALAELFKLKVTQDITTKMLARNVVLWGFDKDWTICFPGALRMLMASWCFDAGCWQKASVHYPMGFPVGPPSILMSRGPASPRVSNLRERGGSLNVSYGLALEALLSCLLYPTGYLGQPYSLSEKAIQLSGRPLGSWLLSDFSLLRWFYSDLIKHILLIPWNQVGGIGESPS